MTDKQQLYVQFEKLENDLKHYEKVGDAGYYKLISEFRQELLSKFHTENSIALHLLERIYEYSSADGEPNTGPNLNLYEYDMLQMLNVSKLDDTTLEAIYKQLSERMYVVVTYSMLCFVRKIMRCIVLKDEQTAILRRLQSLISPLDKRCVKVVIGTITDIIRSWNSADENETLLCDLLELPKWGKLEFYVCMAVFKHVDTVLIFGDVLNRIFNGFRENHTAHSAYVLLQFIVKQDQMKYFEYLLDEVCEVLMCSEAQFNKTMNSSLITYVIPTMCDSVQVDLMSRWEDFSPLYRLHVLRYCYVKDYVKKLNPEIFLPILKDNDDNQELVHLVWEVVCFFPKHTTKVHPRHMDLFMSLLTNYYKSNIPNIRNCIYAFLSQVVIGWVLEDNRHLYIQFFGAISETVEAFMNSKKRRDDNVDERQGFFEAYVFTLILLRGDHTCLKTKYPIPEDCKYTYNSNPMSELRRVIEMNLQDVTKFSVDIDVPNEMLLNIINRQSSVFDNRAKKFLQYTALVACLSPNFDNIQKIQTYTKLLIRLYVKDNNQDLITLLQDELMMIFKDQYSSICSRCTTSALWTNPIYSTAEAMAILAEEHMCPTSYYETLVETTDALLSFVVEKRELLFDSDAKKPIEYIFVNMLKLMYICVKKLGFVEDHSKRLFEQCQSVIIESQLRKPSSYAYNLLTSLMNETTCPSLETFSDFLMNTLDGHLEAIEGKAFNRWTGNREMILLCFKLLKDTPEVFNELLGKMVNSPIGHQESHLRALEAVLKEACLKELTTPFVMPILEKTLENLTHVEYCHRNAAGCLIQIIANRMLGMKSETGERPLCMHQAFERTPKLLKLCTNAFTSNSTSKYGVLCLLAESPYNPSIFGESYDLSPMAFQHLLLEEENSSLCAILPLACANSMNGKLLQATIERNLKEFLSTGVVTNMQLQVLKHLINRFYNYQPWTGSSEMLSIAFQYGHLLKLLGPGEEYEDLRYDYNLLNERIKYMIHGVDVDVDVDNESEEEEESSIVDETLVEDEASIVDETDYDDLDGLDLLDIDEYPPYFFPSVMDLDYSKCPLQENSIAPVAVCRYIHLIFHRLRRTSSKVRVATSMLRKLFNFSKVTVQIAQYHRTLMDIIPTLDLATIAEFLPATVNRQSIYTTEVATLLLCHKPVLTEIDEAQILTLAKNLPLLLKDITIFEYDSVVNSLINFHKLGLAKYDFYYLLFLSLLGVSEKARFDELFSVLWGYSFCAAHGVQKLFNDNIIKNDLGEGFTKFIKVLAKYICSLKKFSVQYSPLFSCLEEYYDVNVDKFIINRVLTEVKLIHR